MLCFYSIFNMIYVSHEDAIVAKYTPVHNKIKQNCETKPKAALFLIT